MAQHDKRVVVAMSGGVDSSVAAALLKQAGCEVIGVTLQLLPCDRPGTARSCCGFESAPLARRVADQLGINHTVLSCEDAFRERVLRPSWEAYQRGLTPNPCVWCNQHLKFGRLLDFARDLGAARVATGHHARLATGASGEPTLARGRDRAKDQSYFLYALDTDQLSRAAFPVGTLTKAEVRTTAAKLGLASAESPESQDACFVDAEGSFAESLRVRFGGPGRAGPLLDDAGQHLGDHEGVHRFTIGQRRGLGVALGRPAWVRAIDPEKAAVWLTTDPDRVLAAGCLIGQPALAAGFETLKAGACRVQVRSRHEPAPARVARMPDGALRIRFDQPQRAVTPGQAAVLYEGDTVVGGGLVAEALEPAYKADR